MCACCPEHPAPRDPRTRGCAHMHLDPASCTQLKDRRGISRLLALRLKSVPCTPTFVQKARALNFTWPSGERAGPLLAVSCAKARPKLACASLHRSGDFDEKNTASAGESCLQPTPSKALESPTTGYWQTMSLLGVKDVPAKYTPKTNSLGFAATVGMSSIQVLLRGKLVATNSCLGGELSAA